MDRLYFVSIIGGISLTKKFEIDDKSIKKMYKNGSFAIFKSNESINYWEFKFANKNPDFSCIIFDITNNASENVLRTCFDNNMKFQSEITELIREFSHKNEPELTYQEKVDFILEKISQTGIDSLGKSEKEFLKNIK
jgi:hypothetical protein